MSDAVLAELRQLIARHLVTSGAPLPLLPNVVLGREDGPTPPCVYVTDPVFSVVAQGIKRIEAGARSYTYGPGQGMTVAIDMPVNAYVADADRDRPFLGFGLRLHAQTIAALLLEHPAAPETVTPAGIVVSDLNALLLDAIVRLLRLLDTPGDIPVLAPAIERELLWRLLNTPQGAMLRQIGRADSHTARIARALTWLRCHFAEPVRITALADMAGMSETSFHRHFRAVTGMTPVQYQKQIRLHAARARLLAAGEDVAQTAFAVGYDSPSQFSREYRRQYGQSPGRDGRRLRAAGAPPALTF